MIKLGQTTTAARKKGLRYLWLVKDMDIYKNYSKERCYVVMGLTQNGWMSLYNGTLKQCREFIGDETPVEI